MKIRLSSFCWQCFNETVKSKDANELFKKERGDETIEVEVNDDNFYEINCPKGHTLHTQLQNQKFEILFDIAAMAIIDGYTKECVSTIASSFERFIEFYIKVIAIKNNVNVEKYIKTWKLMSKQSERQLGAFYMLQLTEFGETKFVIADKWVNFRNKVIHQGYIPMSEEAIEYGEYILSMINSILIELKNNHLESVKKARFLDFKPNGQIIPENQMKKSTLIPTIIDLSSYSSDDFGTSEFRKAIKEISKNSFYKHFYSKNI